MKKWLTGTKHADHLLLKKKRNNASRQKLWQFTAQANTLTLTLLQLNSVTTAQTEVDAKAIAK